ncbi:hypothetical protein LSH36_53g07060 [Paralvinella palmiformis]|uniref:non-specific serine/threonine protein kinase n=1 Tax=Paralvinella palmiformis TaxID=53620 RepID=A0AAD9K5C2_9ANNE|nr:hypothetical protein LSH36_53g07060 [Paralvinella palmiformis]
MSSQHAVSPVSESEHFPSLDERARSSTRFVMRSGRVSPANSAHGSLLRSSLVRITTEKKAKKVRFYRNGDRFFKGMVYAVSPERFRTFESLMSELTLSPICDKTVLPKGVRYLFSIDGSKKITDLDQLEEGESYVCASTQVFHKIDYPKSLNPNWNHNRNRTSRESSATAGTNRFADPEEREYIKPRLVTVVGSGSKPRKAVRILLNKKTAHSFDQVLNDITEAIKLDSGAVKRIFTIGGKQVITLRDFFGEESTFIAYGNERYAMDDFEMDNNEVKFVSAYRSVRQKERIMLKSPKPPRRLQPLLANSPQLTHTNGTNGETVKMSGRQSPKCPSSPRIQRRLQTQTSSQSTMRNKSPTTLSQKYDIGKIIGEGNFATVKECVNKKSKVTYALKIISKDKCCGKEQMIKNEVSILRSLRHANIIQLIEDYDTNDSLYMVMELVTGGDLFDAISTSNNYTERDASATIVTRPLYTVCGTPAYVAPEILAETGYGLPVDIWSAGVLTYVLLCGFPPFSSDSNNQDEQFDKILTGKFSFVSPFWDNISASAKDLITTMLKINAGQRLTADEVLNHPWVSDDDAKDDDIHNTVCSKLEKNFTKRSKQPAVAVLASTALDSGSRYFQGRKTGHGMTHQNLDDEVF